MILLYLLTYLSILVFVVLVISKIVKYSTMPMHLRWDLYPVAHEPERNKYGGSYFEESEWWTKRSHKNHFAEMWAMVEEIFFLKGVYIHNKKIWWFSFPFHLGLYLLVVSFLLIFLSALFDALGIISIIISNNFLSDSLNFLTNLCGYLGLALTFVGAIGLIIKRTTDEKYKIYNTAADFINLFFIIIVVLGISITLLYSNSSFILSKLYVKNLMTFNLAEINESSFIIHVALISLFLLYFPLTRMMHLFAKYFTYHEVRWEDSPNLRGGKLEKRIKGALNFGVSWSASHVKTGETWGEVATTLPPEVKNVEQ